MLQDSTELVIDNSLLFSEIKQVLLPFSYVGYNIYNPADGLIRITARCFYQVLLEELIVVIQKNRLRWHICACLDNPSMTVLALYTQEYATTQ